MRLMHIFWNADLRSGFDGLWSFVRENKGPKPENLGEGSCIVFVNRKRDKVKMLAGFRGEQGVLAYYRSPGGRIEPTALQHLPAAFNGSEIDFKQALRRAIEEKFGVRH